MKLYDGGVIILLVGMLAWIGIRQQVDSRERQLAECMPVRQDFLQQGGKMAEETALSRRLGRKPSSPEEEALYKQYRGIWDEWVQLDVQYTDRALELRKMWGEEISRLDLNRSAGWACKICDASSTTNDLNSEELLLTSRCRTLSSALYISIKDRALAEDNAIQSLRSHAWRDVQMRWRQDQEDVEAECASRISSGGSMEETCDDKIDSATISASLKRAYADGVSPRRFQRFLFGWTKKEADEETLKCINHISKSEAVSPTKPLPPQEIIDICTCSTHEHQHYHSNYQTFKEHQAAGDERTSYFGFHNSCVKGSEARRTDPIACMYGDDDTLVWRTRGANCPKKWEEDPNK
jgi:hypothetical protein